MKYEYSLRYGHDYSAAVSTKKTLSLKYGTYNYSLFNVFKYRRNAAINDSNCTNGPEVVRKAASGLFFGSPYLCWFNEYGKPMILHEVGTWFSAYERLGIPHNNINGIIVSKDSYKSTFDELEEFFTRLGFSNKLSLYENLFSRKIHSNSLNIFSIVTADYSNSIKNVLESYDVIADTDYNYVMDIDNDIIRKFWEGGMSYYENLVSDVDGEKAFYDSINDNGYKITTGYNRISNTVVNELITPYKVLYGYGSSSSSIVEQIMLKNGHYSSDYVTIFENVLSSKDGKTFGEDYSSEIIHKSEFLSTGGIDVLTPHKMEFESYAFSGNDLFKKYFPNIDAYDTDTCYAYGKMGNIFESVNVSPPELQRYIIFEKESVAERPIFEGLINDDITYPFVNKFDNEIFDNWYEMVYKVIPKIFSSKVLFAETPIKSPYDNSFIFGSKTIPSMSLYSIDIVLPPDRRMVINESFIIPKIDNILNIYEYAKAYQTQRDLLENINVQGRVESRNIIAECQIALNVRDSICNDNEFITFIRTDYVLNRFVNDYAIRLYREASSFFGNTAIVNDRYISYGDIDFASIPIRNLHINEKDFIIKDSSRMELYEPMFNTVKSIRLTSLLSSNMWLDRSNKYFSYNNMITFSRRNKTATKYFGFNPVEISYTDGNVYDQLITMDKSDKYFGVFDKRSYMSRPIVDVAEPSKLIRFNNVPKTFGEYVENVFFSKSEKYGIIYKEMIRFSTYAYNIATFENAWASKTLRHLASFDGGHFVRTTGIQGRYMFLSQGFNLGQTSRNVSQFNNKEDVFGEKRYHDLACNAYSFAEKLLRPLMTSYDNNFGYKVYADILHQEKIYSLYKKYTDVHMQDKNYFLYKTIRNSNMYTDEDMGRKSILNVSDELGKENVFAFLNEKAVYTYIYEFSNKNIRNIFYTNKDDNAGKGFIPTWNDEAEEFLNKAKIHSFVQDVNNFITKEYIPLYSHDSFYGISKYYINTWVQEENTFSYKVPKKLWLDSYHAHALKNKHSIRTDMYQTNLYKISKDLHMDTGSHWLLKITHGVSQYSIGNIIERDLFCKKFPHGINIELSNWVSKDLKGVYGKNSGSFLGKHAKPVMITEKELSDVFKGLIDTRTWGKINSIENSIFVTKYPSDTFVDDINRFVNKDYVPVMITHDSFGSKLPKGTFDFSFSLFCDKDSFSVFLANESAMIAKCKASTALKYIGEWVNDGGKPVSGFNNKKLMSSFDNEWVTKDKKHSLPNANLKWFSKSKSAITFEDPSFAQDAGRDVMTFSNEFLQYSPHMVLLEYPTKLSKVLRNIRENNTDFAYRENIFGAFELHNENATSEKSFMTNDTLLSLSKRMYKGVISMYDEVDKITYDGMSNIEQVFIPIQKIPHNGSSIFHQFNWVLEKYHETGIPVEDFGTYAWKYEYPNPFEEYDSEGKIDELLLPEKDFRYENFEDIIFNKKLNRPRNPIKKIDDNTWICKLPTKHPFKNFHEEDGKRYVGVVDENYFGVRVRIMKEVFLKYYQIWQENLFKFATMTMVESSKLILEYLYSWIVLHFPHEDMEEALRVFRQVRWYSESAVINNSQYIVSGDWEDMKMLDIPNNLADNDTMYYDSHTVTFRNTKESVKNTEAYIEFYVDPWKNTTLSFSLINTVGSVNVYIDDELVDTISSTRRTNLYPVNYTGETIVIRIGKDAASNMNTQFMIANVRLEGIKFGSLNVDFDPKLKAGNKPIDAVSKKLMQWANMKDDAEKAYEELLKGNLAQSITVDMMMQYMELHHNNKTKGKRLTIKKS